MPSNQSEYSKMENSSTVTLPLLQRNKISCPWATALFLNITELQSESETPGGVAEWRETVFEGYKKQLSFITQHCKPGMAFTEDSPGTLFSTVI